MGAGQIGGIATLLDLDFQNAAGFLGEKAAPHEGQYLVHFLSHAMMFCVGSLLEAHIILTPAMCVFGEKYKFQVFAGTHKFMEGYGVERWVANLAIHRGYNHTMRFEECSADNLAILVVEEQFDFHKRETGADFMINRIRYGHQQPKFLNCKFFGWGSRRNGYLIPLLTHVQKLDVEVLPGKDCDPTWDFNDRYLCIQQPPCTNEKYGALCASDMGSLLECSGIATAMMVSRLIDRPCTIGFVDLRPYAKFFSCAVDDSRDVLEHEDLMMFDNTSPPPKTNLMKVTLDSNETEEVTV